MSGALLAFCTMAVAVRVLAQTLSISEILAIRAVSGLAVMLGLLALRPELRPAIRTHRPLLNIFRNTIHFGAQYLWAWSLLLLPLATVFSLEFTTPAWTLLLAMPVLGERMTASRLGAVVLGLLGVLVILRPGLGTFQPAALLVLVTALGFAITLTVTKLLTRTDTNFGIIFWMNLVQSPLALAGSDLNFPARVNADQWPALVALAVAGLASHYCVVNAFRSGDASVVVPLDFLRIPLIAVIGWLLYNESLDAFVFLGAGLIIAGVLWNLRSEARRAFLPAAADRALP